MGFIFLRQDCPHYSGALYPKATNKAPSQHGDKSQTFQRLLNLNALWHPKCPLIPAGSSLVPALLVLLGAKQALGLRGPGQGRRFCWDQGAWLLQHRDIWVSSGGSCKVPPRWGSAPHIVVAVVATAGIKPLQGTGSSWLDADQG